VAPAVAAAQRSLTAVLRPADLAVDATAGNGHDTVFLARAVGPAGRVVAVDKQAEAVARSGERLRQAGLAQRVSLRTGGHEALGELVPSGWAGRVRAVVFNLGYLPGGEGPVITGPRTTLAALEAALYLLAPGGRLAVVAYPGHAGGEAEALAVSGWARALPGRGLRAVAAGAARPERSPRSPRLTVVEWPLASGSGQARPTGNLPTIAE
jgi:predicted methyltransferase